MVISVSVMGPSKSHFEINIPAEKNHGEIIHWSSFPSIQFLGLPMTTH